eukprot:Hpha_TRINITY_DN14582_c0_g1::TRINITY_DN14582_c0_g1_i1::g.46958::m.46958
MSCKEKCKECKKKMNRILSPIAAVMQRFVAMVRVLFCVKKGFVKAWEGFGTGMGVGTLAVFVAAQWVDPSLVGPADGGQSVQSPEDSGGVLSCNGDDVMYFLGCGVVYILMAIYCFLHRRWVVKARSGELSVDPDEARFKAEKYAGNVASLIVSSLFTVGMQHTRHLQFTGPAMSGRCSFTGTLTVVHMIMWDILSHLAVLQCVIRLLFFREALLAEFQSMIPVEEEEKDEQVKDPEEGPGIYVEVPEAQAELQTLRISPCPSVDRNSDNFGPVCTTGKETEKTEGKGNPFEQANCGTPIHTPSASPLMPGLASNKSAPVGRGVGAGV